MQLLLNLVRVSRITAENTLLFGIFLHRLFIVLIVSFFTVGCQKEYEETYFNGEDEVIIATDSIVEYIVKMTQNDGSFDDLIDDCSEICIEFPYSIKIRNEKFEISSKEDLEVIVNDYSEYANNITIDYPVTIMYSDYSEESIPNRGELNKVQHEYSTTDQTPKVSVDFVYPVIVSVYNTLYQSFDVKNTNEDKEMYVVFNSIDDLIVAFNYPVTILNSDGDSFDVDDNEELQIAMENSME